MRPHNARPDGPPVKQPWRVVSALFLIAMSCGDPAATQEGVSAEAGQPADPTTAGESPSSPEVWGDRARVLASGEVNGVTWRAFGWWNSDSLAADEVLCLESESERFPASPVCPGGLAPLNSFQAGGRTIKAPQIVLTDEVKFVVGMIEKGPVRVVVEMSSGPPVEAVIVGDDGTYYVAALRLDASPSEVVAYAVSGAELDRRGFDDPSDGDTPQSPTRRIEYHTEDPPPCVEPDVDEALCGSTAPSS